MKKLTCLITILLVAFLLVGCDMGIMDGPGMEYDPDATSESGSN